MPRLKPPRSRASTRSRAASETSRMLPLLPQVPYLSQRYVDGNHCDRDPHPETGQPRPPITRQADLRIMCSPDKEVSRSVALRLAGVLCGDGPATAAHHSWQADLHKPYACDHDSSSATCPNVHCHAQLHAAHPALTAVRRNRAPTLQPRSFPPTDAHHCV